MTCLGEWKWWLEGENDAWRRSLERNGGLRRVGVKAGETETGEWEGASAGEGVGVGDCLGGLGDGLFGAHGKEGERESRGGGDAKHLTQAASTFPLTWSLQVLLSIWFLLIVNYFLGIVALTISIRRIGGEQDYWQGSERVAASLSIVGVNRLGFPLDKASDVSLPCGGLNAWRIGRSKLISV
ncbi:hypothetical protein R3P38DRAFT_3341196 [Favolaschia claudopus]|uniref:Uncharacterized protein n=1 Tax=Favolaschia claudopus TaxID=2862362 RepID=A0AAW0E7Z4_9AGAR